MLRKAGVGLEGVASGGLRLTVTPFGEKGFSFATFAVNPNAANGGFALLKKASTLVPLAAQVFEPLHCGVVVLGDTALIDDTIGTVMLGDAVKNEPLSPVSVAAIKSHCRPSALRQAILRHGLICVPRADGKFRFSSLLIFNVLDGNNSSHANSLCALLWILANAFG